MSDRITVHMEGAEGAIHVDAKDGRILTPVDERPEWAEGHAVALLGERVGWYEQRLCQPLPDNLRSPETVAYQDLGWIGVDAEGDEVEIEADADYRMTMLSNALGVDREDYDDQKHFKNAIASAEVAHTYRDNQTDETTLAEAEGETFAEKKAATGT